MTRLLSKVFLAGAVAFGAAAVSTAPAAAHGYHRHGYHHHHSASYHAGYKRGWHDAQVAAAGGGPVVTGRSAAVGDPLVYGGPFDNGGVLGTGVLAGDGVLGTGVLRGRGALGIGVLGF